MSGHAPTLDSLIIPSPRTKMQRTLSDFTVFLILFNSFNSFIYLQLKERRPSPAIDIAAFSQPLINIEAEMGESSLENAS
jgi:hypothetical protein